MVIWITGLPASGKTTLARAVADRLRARGGRVEALDGDEIRALFPSVGYSAAERDQHIRRVGHLASRLEAHDVAVVVSMVSPIRAAREFARALCREFIEVRLTTPVEECVRRDPKGLYRQAAEGAREYEPSPAPELELDTSARTVAECVEAILDRAGCA